jgi:hypothetical protein
MSVIPVHAHLQIAQQRQMLLGPSAAVAAAGKAGQI